MTININDAKKFWLKNVFSHSLEKKQVDSLTLQRSGFFEGRKARGGGGATSTHHLPNQMKIGRNIHLKKFWLTEILLASAKNQQKYAENHAILNWP